jgi:hypothetical protein
VYAKLNVAPISGQKNGEEEEKKKINGSAATTRSQFWCP